MSEFVASKRTMLKALKAMKQAEYPERAGKSPDNRRKWEEHHQECISRIAEMILEKRWS